MSETRRRRISDDSDDSGFNTGKEFGTTGANETWFQGATLHREISPPRGRKRAKTEEHSRQATTVKAADVVQPSFPQNGTSLVPSPIQLNYIEQLPSKSNVDTLSITDVLGHPLLKEVWQFNYLFDLDFLL
jgi:tyrosyl-DNA phosphodiesterase 1